MKLRSILIITFIWCFNTYAFYWDTLPQGIRSFDYWNITTDGIRESFDANGNSSSYDYKVDINSDVMKEIPGLEYFFEDLKSISPQAYSKFSIGAFAIDAKAEVNAQVFAVGYGVTDRLSLYVGIPYYTASVKMNYKQTKFNSYKEVAALINEYGNEDLHDSYEYIISEVLPNVTAENLQYILTNYYGYSPAGTWQGQGYGDVEIGAMYRLTESTKYGAKLSYGLVAPTGVIDDSSTLQDIAFGDGQWDLFGEIGAGIVYKSFTFNTKFRYDYQMPGNKSMRVPIDQEFTLSDQEKDFYVKLGDKIEYNFWSEYYHNDWFSVFSGYVFNYQFATDVDSGNKYADSILEFNTDSYAHSMRAGVTFDTVSLFKAQRFLIPTQTSFVLQSMIFGKNTPKVSRIQLQFRLFF